MSQNILRNLTNVQTEGVGMFLESNMTVEKWLTLAEKDWESAWGGINSWDLEHLYHDDGWYRIYKTIIPKNPSLIRNVSTYVHFLSQPYGRPFCELENEWGGVKRRRISDQQYNELCEMAGDAYTQWQNEPIEKARRIKQAQEQFLAMVS